MNKLGRSVVAALLFAGTLALAGCADKTTPASAGTGVLGGTTGPGTGPGPAPGPTGIRVQLLASSPQMPSSGTATVDLTAVVVDTNGQAVSGSTVVFSTGADPTAFITNISNPAPTGGGVSDANGSVTAKLNLGSNRSNRFISVTATTQGATAATGVDVTGTTISVSGNSSLALGASTTLTFSLTDSAGVALSGFPMTLTSAAGNPIATPSGTTTDSSGQVVANVTGAVAGNDTITATAGGTSKTQSLTISGSSFAFTTPAANVDIPLNTSTPVSINWPAGVGQLVSFSSSRGAIAGSPATNVGGNTPGVTVSSATAGPAIITASGPLGTPAATLNVTFVATTASSVAVQAVPGTVAVTTGAASQTSNQSIISVVVRDVNNNLVKNANVNFTINLDPSGGSLASGSAITDVTGSASVTYIAGGTSSGQNGVVIDATVTLVNGVAIAPVTGTAMLTVSGQALLVRLGTDNLVQSEPPVNKKKWVAVVTDAAGNAVAGATVRFALRPGRYRKGFFFVPAPPAVQRWNQQVLATCPNEDINFNGILDPGEDFNGNGALEPPGVATVNPSGVTDASGIAEATITYPKNYALWTEVILEARTGVSTNDPPAQATFFLVGLASDYENVQISPPGQFSPFGDTSGSCADTL